MTECISGSGRGPCVSLYVARTHSLDRRQRARRNVSLAGGERWSASAVGVSSFLGSAADLLGPQPYIVSVAFCIHPKVFSFIIAFACVGRPEGIGGYRSGSRLAFLLSAQARGVHTQSKSIHVPSR